MVSKIRILTLATAVGLGLIVGSALGQDEHAHHGMDQGNKMGMKQVGAVKEAAAKAIDALPNVVASKAYPLDKCIVSGEALGGMGEPVSITHEGREIKFCCKGCIPKFKADPETYLKKLDKAIIDSQAAHYPLKSCPITGESLTAMGKPYDMLVGNRLVRLCCKGCAKKVKANSEKVLARLDQAVAAAQIGTYPLETCIVTGEELGGTDDTINYVYGTTLVRLCCKGCIRRFEAEPQKYLPTLMAAYKAKAKNHVEHALEGMSGKMKHHHDGDGDVKPVSTGGCGGSCGGCGGEGGSGK